MGIESHEKHEVGDEVIVIGAEYGVILEVRENDHYRVDVENRGERTLHAQHLQACGRKRSDYEWRGDDRS